MNNKNIFAFVLGAAVGAAVSWKVLKSKYEQIAREEAEEVREVYANKLKEIEGHKYTGPNQSDEADDTETYENITNNYTGDHVRDDVSTGSNIKPYVITPDEFGELETYDARTYTFYEGNGVLTDEDDERVENIEQTVGYDAFNHFEDDAVFIRNDALKCDYEILLCNDSYSDSEYD